MEDIVNNNIKLIMLDLVGVLVFERDDVLNDKEDKIERLFGPNLSDEEYLTWIKKYFTKSLNKIIKFTIFSIDFDTTLTINIRY